MYRDKFTICNRLSELEQIQIRLKCFLHQHCCQRSLVDEMILIAEELIVNIINNGYPDQQQRHLIDIEFHIDNQQNLNMIFCDDALPFNPLTVQTPTLGLSSEHVAIGGLGIPLVKALSDQQHYQYQYQQGKNILHIKKSLSYNKS